MSVVYAASLSEVLLLYLFLPLTLEDLLQLWKAKQLTQAGIEALTIFVTTLEFSYLHLRVLNRSPLFSSLVLRFHVLLGFFTSLLLGSLTVLLSAFFVSEGFWAVLPTTFCQRIFAFIPLPL